tara:strand:- start:471 stop:944 length:474 start_codon:yes stop_codon:yes gene_type:complete
MLFPTKTAVIIKGLSGSGKSSFAQAIAAEHAQAGCSVAIHETDNFFIQDGVYTFDPSKIREFHAQNLANFTDSIISGVHLVICPNTNNQLWEFVGYLDVAIEHGYATVVYDLFDAGLTEHELCERNKHGFPLEKYKLAKQHYERGISNLDPRHWSDR